MARGRDRTRDHPLALAATLHGRAQLLDATHGLMPDGQAPGNRILALEDVDVGPTDGRGGDTHEGVERPDPGIGFSISSIRPSSIRPSSMNAAAFIVLAMPALLHSRWQPSASLDLDRP
jgi:hypothetical protein